MLTAVPIRFTVIWSGCVKETETRYYLPDHVEGLDESLPLDFSTPYGCSKGSADQYVRDWARVYGLKTVVFRLLNLWWPTICLF